MYLGISQSNLITLLLNFVVTALGYEPCVTRSTRNTFTIRNITYCQ